MMTTVRVKEAEESITKSSGKSTLVLSEQVRGSIDRRQPRRVASKRDKADTAHNALQISYLVLYTALSAL